MFERGSSEENNMGLGIGIVLFTFTQSPSQVNKVFLKLTTLLYKIGTGPG